MGNLSRALLHGYCEKGTGPHHAFPRRNVDYEMNKEEAEKEEGV
jgi:hypothetical protein